MSKLFGLGAAPRSGANASCARRAHQRPKPPAVPLGPSSLLSCKPIDKLADCQFT